jgi:hypothetical protein
MIFNSLFTETITMFWRVGGTYVDGRFVEGAPEQSQEITASVQRLAPRDRELLPEGFRASESIKIYTQIDVVRLIENNENPALTAAEFEYQGTRFVMLASDRWEYLIPHWKVTAVAK